ncbi:MAG TPA: Xaa-Pro aminopeptidase [Marinilabiliales bacterium]|jgi:Xaa-Pro aminopeptidase|nr:MAG: Xaa-Pro aminopeptidase [Bacteroidetes bacterium GWA2_40_14]OFX59356.1 MAG: Xaa-Pro aminopeptidase [Bacteroidetes bacterium GWC2_40_13]OFX73551.1 MAG: Xaa-Pro aminopeptidase [Bacteroidetes bacterium GWD2_40_43]OFX90773.1 MAG: Xaa-Pro aminopeptidase [Bacteroidetes bacterium GWE2_40_63]OFY20595.1 MAG: Xaa-Pro aminopeptidase [Bacteroidetes bacterium GWF2_40_13]OFZ24689.1 MAG: Xaa-Pro aminopeptidase [Bacteroidetes bacterium RIFOXYC2_FULL_40_12]HAN00509.1 Xaa-Pro aminopeptidase [Marinilabil
MFQKEVYIRRRSDLKKLVTKGIGLFLGNLETPMNYPDNTYHFRQDSSFLYFFGINHPGLAAVIDFESGEEILFGNDVEIEDIIWMGIQPLLKDKATRVGVEKSFPSEKLNDYLKAAIKLGRPIHFLPQYRGDNKILLGDLLGIHPGQLNQYRSLELIKAIVKLRSIKDAFEIEEIEKACAMGYEMHVTAMKMALSGQTEQMIAGVVESIPYKYGGRISFPVILSQDGQTLHNHYHTGILQKGRLVINDSGAETAMGYASDFTRTIPVDGTFTQKQKEIYQIVLNANNTATQISKPGITYQQVHLQVAKVIAQGLKDVGLMKGDVDAAVKAGAHALFFPHGLGHMMGLDVHDMEDLGQIYVGYDEITRPIDQFGTAYLRLGRKLEPGFVITNEPGIYFIPALIDKWLHEKINHEFINFEKANQYRDFGGIRIEDDLLITETGCRLLGNRIPATVDEVEKTVGMQ